MTLNGVIGHFTLNFHYYELPLTNYLLLIYCKVYLHLGLQLHVTSGEVWEVPYRNNPWVTHWKLMEFHGKNMDSMGNIWILHEIS